MKVLSVDGLSKLISLMKEDFVESSSLSTVATSGSYNDLTNKPTIPTIDQTYNTSSANAQSGVAIAGAGFLKNTATGTNSITILGTSASYESSVNIGQGSSVQTFDVAIGRGATATNGGNCVSVGFFASSTSQSTSIGSNSKSQALRSIAIGTSAKAEANYAIQLGYGTNSEANSFYVATSDSNNYKLLGSDGKIPSGRLQIATSVSSSSTNDETVGAKLFYDTVGDIEAALHAINSGS